LPSPRPEENEPACAGLIAENFKTSESAEVLESRLQWLAGHAASALHNALCYQETSGGLLRRATAWLRSWTRGKRSRKAIVGAVVALLILAFLTLVSAELRLDARGQLLPRDRQIVYAHLHGKVVDLKAQHGDVVEKGQELLFLEDLESQLKIDQLGLKATYAEQRLAVLGEQITRAGGEERNNLIKERITQEYELHKAVAERDILLQGGLNPRKAPVLAPLAGKVVTFDAREQLVGKTVKPGDTLVRIARVEGPWEIELLLPEGRIAPLQEGLQRSPDGELSVDLLLASQPLRTYQGKLRKSGLGGETIVKDNVVVLPVRVAIADAELLTQLASLPVGLEVRARVHCGSRSLGRVWFGDLLEYFYEHVWF
jgi:biotin carboxyl carrier protein